MCNRPKKFGLFLLAFGAGTLWARPSPASLGGDAASVTADAAELHASVQSTPRPQYQMQEMTNENGLHVREFLNSDGIVFAVTWNGWVTPDLRALLGSSFASYIKGLNAQGHPGTPRFLRVAAADLVVESGGHMRAYSGRAYLPAQIPPGVPLSELR